MLWQIRVTFTIQGKLGESLLPSMIRHGISGKSVNKRQLNNEAIKPIIELEKVKR